MILCGLLLQIQGLEAQKREEPQTPVKAEENVFLADVSWEYDGFIVGERDKKTIMGQGDIVFLDIGRKQRVVAFDRFTIYRREKEIVHPDTNEPLGFMLRKVGVVEVTSDIQDNTASARVVMTHEPIAIGDFVKRQPPPPAKKKKGQSTQTGR